MKRQTQIAGLTLSVFALIAASHWLGGWGNAWSLADGPRFAPPSAEHWLGTNSIGQDIAARAAAGAALAFETGLLVALAAAALGGLLGLVAGYYHQRAPDLIVGWLLAIFDAVPFYLLVAAFAYAARDAAWAIPVALCLAFWTPTARLVRAETLKLRNTGYVLAARTLGIPPVQILLRELLPNLMYLLLIQAAITFVAAVKTEVVLSFLGLGDASRVSWGQMIAESTQELLTGHFANFVVASGCLIALVISLNLIADALQAHFDPQRPGSL
ncbi:MAG: ABC transporter permease subunit [Pseudomonadota bacterium]